jgi:hypothetical protein
VPDPLGVHRRDDGTLDLHSAALCLKSQLGLTLTPALQTAHDDVSNSPERIKYLQSLEEKMYACGPKIAKYQALRKRTVSNTIEILS